MSTSPTLNQLHYRFRTDAGAVDATPIWGVGEDVPFYPGLETAFRIRLTVQNTGTAAGAGPHIPRLSKNGGAYAAITTASTGGVQSADAGASADAAAMATANFRLTAGAGTALAGVYDENGSTTLSITNGFFTELEYGFIVKTANITPGDVLDFEVYNSTTAYTTYTRIPRIVIPETPGTDFAFDRLLGSNGSITANQASIALTSNFAIASGRLVVIVVACDNFQTTDGDEGAVTGIIDSVGGNTWIEAVEFCNGQGSAQAGATVSIWYSVLTNPLVVGSTVTANFSNATSRDAAAITGKSWTLAAGKTLFVQGTATLANDALDPGSLDVTTANVECLRVRGTAMEYTGAVDITTSNTTTWGPFLKGAGSTGTAATSMAVYAESYISVGIGQASDPTIAAADCASAYVAFSLASPQTLTATKYSDTVEAFGVPTMGVVLTQTKFTDPVESFGVPTIATTAPARYWVGGGTNTNWNSSPITNWAATSGGPGNQSVPTSIHDVFFDAASGSGTSNLSAGITINSLDMAGFTGTFTWAIANLQIAGNGVVCRFSASGPAITFGSGSILTFTGTSGVTLLTSNGKGLPGVTLSGAGGTVQLQDALNINVSVNYTLTLSNGTFDANGFNVTLGVFNTNNTNVRGLKLGSGLWTLAQSASNWTINGANITFDKGSADIVYDAVVAVNVAGFTGGGLAYNGIYIKGANAASLARAFVFNGSNTFTTVTFDNTLGGLIVNFGPANGTKQTLTSLVMTVPRAYNPIEFCCSTSPHANCGFAAAAGTITFDKAILANCIVSGGATFNATNSYDIGGNSGWASITPP